MPTKWAPRVVKADSEGGIEWQKGYGESGYLWTLIPSRDGGWACAGWVDPDGKGSFQALLLKLDGGGRVEWQRCYGGNGYDSGMVVREAVDPAGGFLLAGQTRSFTTGDFGGAWLLRTDPDGNVEGTCSFIRSIALTGEDLAYEMVPSILRSRRTACTETVTAALEGEEPPLSLRQCMDPPCSSDPFEEDDVCGSSAGEIVPGERQGRNFCADTGDWVSFLACRGRDYVLRTSGLDPMTDTVLDLYAPDCATLIASNDDPAVGGRSSWIAWTASETAVHHARVFQWDDTTGLDRGYDLTLEGDPSPCPEPPGEVSPPGSVQPLVWTDRSTLVWAPGVESGSTAFNLYRGGLEVLGPLGFGGCLQAGVPVNQASDPEAPGPGAGWFYLVAGTNQEGEGPLGSMQPGGPRPNGFPCP